MTSVLSTGTSSLRLRKGSRSDVFSRVFEWGLLRMPSGVVLLRMPSGVVLCGPYPTPRLGIAAPQAVSEMFGCGVGEPTSHSDAGSVMGLVCRPRLGVGVNACPGSCIRRPGSELCQKCYITSWCPLPTPGYTEKRTEAITMRVFFHGLLIYLGSERLAKIDEKASISRLKRLLRSKAI